jgi:uncharacterized protein
MNKLDLPPFKELFPWWGGDLQTIATAFLGAPTNVAPHTSERMRFPVSGDDTLLATLDRPVDPKPYRPLVILIHGTPGSETSPYMIRMACYLLMQGYCVLRLNLRGAGDSRAVCGGQYYAGSSGDIRQLVALLPPELTQHGIAAVGYSLGGAILLKYLGEEGSRAPICAAVTVSAPIDLLGTCRNLMSFRNGLYHWYVFSRMKAEATKEGARLTCLERANIEASRTLWQYDDLFTAPRNGFRGAADYYAECSAVNFLSGIRTPTLLITSLDDPWVPGGAYSGNYWRSNESLSVQPLLSPRGGHVGFHGVGDSHPWSDLAAAQFLANLA